MIDRERERERGGKEKEEGRGGECCGENQSAGNEIATGSRSLHPMTGGRGGGEERGEEEGRWGFAWRVSIGLGYCGVG